jgi:predicted DNA-binding protein (MmcQ/YjbR family)
MWYTNLKPKGGFDMTKESFFSYCLDSFGTVPDYPFDEDFETAVLRHSENRKWYAIVMKVSRRKFGFRSDEAADVVNLKLPTEMFGSFGSSDGVFPAYHMNKQHWISVILSDAPDDVVAFLTSVSFEATKAKKKTGAPKRRENLN